MQSPERIDVTKTFLPPIDEYWSYLNQIWETHQLTNQGPLLLEFERQVIKYLDVQSLHFVANGTMALQLALRALNINGSEVITTPFSYVATTSSILWENCYPKFVDIDPESLCIDPNKIEAAITRRTKAIMPVHVFGHPCDVEKIELIARKHKLKVIYDGAHAFGVKYQGRSLLDYGDISVCSFHATKLFHTIEGGCLITKNTKTSNNIELIKRFGHHGDDYHMLGINGKATEFQAAMGLCNLKYIDDIIKDRQKVSRLYDKFLDDRLNSPTIKKGTKYNYAYYPIILERESILLKAIKKLNAINVFPRRYFYPSLNTLPYLKSTQSCPVSEDISKRIMCLPLYYGLKSETAKNICKVLLK
jgi:dTDP-4-amino-4,6-dideoxygalactose transaminase